MPGIVKDNLNLLPQCIACTKTGMEAVRCLTVLELTDDQFKNAKCGGVGTDSDSVKDSGGQYNYGQKGKPPKGLHSASNSVRGTGRKK